MTTKRNKEWFDNDKFWKEMYPFMFPELSFEAASKNIKNILILTKPKGKALLDLCCGPGRYSIPFTKKGFKVTGVDRTKYLLNKARSLSKKANAKIEWIQKDMRDFVRAESFDLVINMFTSFGYFDNKNEDVVVLKNIYNSLKKGGTLILETIGKEPLASIFQPVTANVLNDAKEFSKRTKMVQFHLIFDDWTRIRNEWIIIKKGKASSFTFYHTIYSGQELRSLLKSVGFTKIKLFGNLSGDEYGFNAPRLVAVCQK